MTECEINYVISLAMLELDCDTARITSPGETNFLIIGWKRRSDGEWKTNNQPFDFDYIQEQIVASGKNKDELIESIDKYAMIKDMEMDKYIEFLLKEK